MIKTSLLIFGIFAAILFLQVAAGNTFGQRCANEYGLEPGTLEFRECLDTLSNG